MWPSESIGSPYETGGKTNHATYKCYPGSNATKPPLNSKPATRNRPQVQDRQKITTDSIHDATQLLNYIYHFFFPEMQWMDLMLPNQQHFRLSLSLFGSKIKTQPWTLLREFFKIMFLLMKQRELVIHTKTEREMI